MTSTPPPDQPTAPGSGFPGDVPGDATAPVAGLGAEPTMAAPTTPPPGGGGIPPSGGSVDDSDDGNRRAWIIGGSIAAVVVLGAIIAVILILSSDDKAAADEVFLEPISDVGVDPFTDSVGDGTDIDVSNQIDVTASSNGIATIDADTVGLYGGTLDESSCDRDQLVAFLAQNPDKAAAWAGVFGMEPEEIGVFVQTLTPVLLRSDTRVTNHGFTGTTANPIQSVLQAGSAVLVDRFGQPAVRCACGNPLLTPTAVSSPTYTRPAWPTWDPDRVTVIQKTTVVIDTFVLVDPVTGETFERPAGTDGQADKPANEPTPTTTTTSPTTTQPPATQPTTPQPTTTGDDAIAIFEDARNNGCAGVVFPFEPHVSETITASPANGPDLWSVQVVGVVAGGGQQVFVWTVNAATGALTPANQLAAEAAAVCPALGS